LFRFDFDIPATESVTFIYVVPFIVVSRCISFYITGLYKIATHNNVSTWKTKLAIIQLIVSLFFVFANIILRLCPFGHYLIPNSIVLIEYLLSTVILVMLLDRNGRFSTQRNFGLDVLRACSIICVLLIHGGSIIRGHPKLLHIYSFFQIDGVTMFFVLSGFLIGNILIKAINETSFTIKNLYGFWIRRWFRTLPNYYLVLLFFIFIYHKLNDKLPNDLINYFFFSQNLRHGCTFEFFGASWSLCVEEWFYLLIPIFLFSMMYITKQVSKKWKILSVYFV